MQTMTLKLKVNKTAKAHLDALFAASTKCYNALLKFSLEFLQKSDEEKAVILKEIRGKDVDAVKIKHLTAYDLGALKLYKDFSPLNSYIYNMLCARVENVIKQFIKSEEKRYYLYWFYLEKGCNHFEARKNSIKSLKNKDEYRGLPRIKNEKRCKACFSYLKAPTVRNFCLKIDGTERDYILNLPKEGKKGKNIQVKGRANFVVEDSAEAVEVRFIRDNCGTYWAKVVWRSEAPALEKGEKVVGVDLGLKHAVNFSNKSGDFAGKETMKSYAKRLKALQNASKNQKRALPYIHRKIKNERNIVQRTIANKLVKNSKTIYIGDCNSSKWLSGFKGRLARSCADVAHASFIEILRSKAERAGVEFNETSEKYSSRLCHRCGHYFENLSLNDRQLSCPDCGSVFDRDLNAAINIIKIGEGEIIIGKDEIQFFAEDGLKSISLQKSRQESASANAEGNGAAAVTAFAQTCGDSAPNLQSSS